MMIARHANRPDPIHHVSRKVVVGLLAVGSLLAAATAIADGTNATREITDMAGRRVRIPAVVRAAYPTSPMGDILLYTLAPEKIVGLSWNLTPDERKLLLDVYAKKPVLGGWFGKNTTGNPEVILQARPDVAVSVAMDGPDPTSRATADRMQAQLGIPVVLLDGSLSNLVAAYTLAGEVMGAPARAAVLAAWCTNALQQVQAVARSIPENERVRVYYAEGSRGLETDPRGSPHAEVLEWVGGCNVADVPLLRGYGRAAVSFEQLLVWNPDLVIVGIDRSHGDGAENYAHVSADPTWQRVPAVVRGRHYAIPSLPFNWFDRPPCVNRIIGALWLSNLLYPERLPLDIRAKTREFYELFYQHKLTEPELDEVLQHATPTKRAPATPPAGK
jgi:iron complex transport system substrate-binding protein